MRQLTLWIFSVIILPSCASSPKSTGSAPPLEKYFSEPYELVWQATQLALSKYPIQINDAESGVFETQYVRGEKSWASPQQTPTVGGHRYRLVVHLIKDTNDDDTTSVHVVILKRAEVQRDFFSEYEKEPSDGLEELALMYRIEREIQIAKALKRIKK